MATTSPNTSCHYCTTHFIPLLHHTHPASLHHASPAITAPQPSCQYCTTDLLSQLLHTPLATTAPHTSCHYCTTDLLPLLHHTPPATTAPHTSCHHCITYILPPLHHTPPATTAPHTSCHHCTTHTTPVFRMLLQQISTAASRNCSISWTSCELLTEKKHLFYDDNDAQCYNGCIVILCDTREVHSTSIALYKTQKKYNLMSI